MLKTTTRPCCWISEWSIHYITNGLSTVHVALGGLDTDVVTTHSAQCCKKKNLCNLFFKKNCDLRLRFLIYASKIELLSHCVCTRLSTINLSLKNTGIVPNHFLVHSVQTSAVTKFGFVENACIFFFRRRPRLLAWHAWYLLWNLYFLRLENWFYEFCEVTENI